MMMAWMERGEVGEEVERPMAMELLDSELVYFSEDYKKFTSLESCSLITSGCSTCSAAAAITSSQSCTATPEEVSNYRRSSSSSKKQRTGRSASLGTIKVRKDKLGDKILALQHLVSPFCKSDTASVLHEALGYIRFLHDQIQVLSSPYLLQRLPSATAACRLQGGGSEDQWSGGGGGAVSDLRSRGLCLVSIACTTAEVTNDSGADFWCCACAATEYSTAQSTKN